MASNNSKIWEIMGIDATTGEGTYKNRMGLGNAITRDNGIPLDLSTLHNTYEDAVVYAATKGIAYVGQILTAGETVYVLTATSQGKIKIASYRDSITGKLVTGEEKEYDIYLKPVGVIPSGDNKTITVEEDGLISIYNFENAGNDTLPQKKAVYKKDDEGNVTTEIDHYEIQWVSVNAIVEGDGNTKTVVESGDNELVKITPKRDETNDINTYVIDVNTYDKNELDEIINNLPYKWGEEKLPVSEEVMVSYIPGGDSRFEITGLDFDTSTFTDYENLVLPRTYYGGSEPDEIATEGYISSEVFSGTDYTDLEYVNIYIPSNIMKIGAGNFDAFPNLENIYYELDQAAWEEVCDPNYVPEHVTVHYNYEMREQITVQKALGGVEEKVAAIEGDYKITLTSRTDEQGDDHSALKHYILAQGGKEIGHIDIPTDLVVQSGTVITATDADKEVNAEVVVGEVYIKLVIANQEEPLYIAAKDLVEYITVDTTGKTIKLELGDDHVLKAEVKLHTATEGEAANAIEIKDDGLYVKDLGITDDDVQNLKQNLVIRSLSSDFEIIEDGGENGYALNLTSAFKETLGDKNLFDTINETIFELKEDEQDSRHKELTIKDLATAPIVVKEEEKTLLDFINEKTNKIEGITFNGVAVEIDENKVVNIVYELPVADDADLGGVLSIDPVVADDGTMTEEEAERVQNTVRVHEDGKMEVNLLNVDKLVQTVGTRLVLNGGNASLD